MSATEHEDETRHEEEWVYLGERMTPKGKRAYAWLPHVVLDTGGDDPKWEAAERWYTKKIAVGTPTIGSVYAVTLDASDRVVTGGDATPRYVWRLDDDHPLRPAFQMKAAKHSTQLDAIARVRKAKKEDRGLGTLTLDQLQREWHRTLSAPRRNALLAAIIGHVTSTRVAEVDTDVEV